MLRIAGDAYGFVLLCPTDEGGAISDAVLLVCCPRTIPSSGGLYERWNPYVPGPVPPNPWLPVGCHETLYQATRKTPDGILGGPCPSNLGERLVWNRKSVWKQACTHHALSRPWGILKVLVIPTLWELVVRIVRPWWHPVRRVRWEPLSGSVRCTWWWHRGSHVPTCPQWASLPRVGRPRLRCGLLLGIALPKPVREVVC